MNESLFCSLKCDRKHHALRHHIWQLCKCILSSRWVIPTEGGQKENVNYANFAPAFTIWIDDEYVVEHLSFATTWLRVNEVRSERVILLTCRRAEETPSNLLLTWRLHLCTANEVETCVYMTQRIIFHSSDAFAHWTSSKYKENTAVFSHWPFNYVRTIRPYIWIFIERKKEKVHYPWNELNYHFLFLNSISIYLRVIEDKIKATY